MRYPLAALRSSLVALLAVSVCVGCTDEATSGDAAANDAGLEDAAGDDVSTDDTGVQEYPPIVVAPFVHGDPVPSAAFLDLATKLRIYEGFRDGMRWYVDLAAATGLRLSAQVTGVYAEAILLSGDQADYAGFMPGGLHHLGTHLHQEAYDDSPLVWHNVADPHDPSQVLEVFNDNIGFVNDLFEANGTTIADNWFLHGTQVTFTGIEGPLVHNDGSMSTTYPNVFTACGGVGGVPFAFRGNLCDGAAAAADGLFVKIPEIGGIIGFDRLHGPGGGTMRYGTVPYQRRDFLRVFLEWRENARLHPDAPPLHFNYMVHPYELVEGTMGTDDVLVRQSISDFVGWLVENFVSRTDREGRVIAGFGTVRDIVQRFGDWEAAHPDRRAALAAEMNAGTFLRRLPGIYAALERAYHQETLDLGAAVAAHRLVERDTGTSWVLIFTDAGSVDVPASGSIPASRDVMSGDGTVRHEDSATLTVGESPLLVGPPGTF